ncbi:MAG: hypothetical protein ACE5HT_08380 [Gemmatimonadales bacterium]
MRERSLLVTISLAAGLCTTASSLSAQGRILDRGQFLIYRGADVVGREEFVVTKGRTGSGQGYTIAAASFYPPDSPTPVAVAALEAGPDSQPSAARIDLNSGRNPSVLVVFGPRRITVRTVTPEGESARQYPAAGRIIVLDDLVISGYLIPPGLEEGLVTFFRPRTSERIAARLSNAGRDRTMVERRGWVLTHFTLESSGETRHLWFDERGRLIKLEAPATNLTALRVNLVRR